MRVDPTPKQAEPQEAGPLDLKTLPQIWMKVPGFEPIPFEKIGPQ